MIIAGKDEAWQQTREHDDYPGSPRERSEFCVTLKMLQRHHSIQSPLKING
ncbi:hypothetical protein G3D99_004815 [Salmonella enterica subsp. enterica]|nr:hypothetical protein [Salmonella enterica subsp. enterica serovar Bredeney]EEG5421657.1 hypothetical protein [Salmonella enterica subsp. enterica]